MVNAMNQRISAGSQDNQASTDSPGACHGHITAAAAHNSPQDPDGSHTNGSHTNGSHTNGSHTVGGEQNITEDDVIFELHHLRRRLQTLPVIEQSKGVLMGRYGIDADSAFNVLRRLASVNNIKLRDISQQIVTAATASKHPTGPRAAMGDVLRSIGRVGSHSGQESAKDRIEGVDELPGGSVRL